MRDLSINQDPPFQSLDVWVTVSSYMRHTEQWFESLQSIALDESLEYIENESLFIP